MTIEEANKLCDLIQEMHSGNVYRFNDLAQTRYTNYAKIYQLSNEAEGISHEDVDQLNRTLNLLPDNDFMWLVRLTDNMPNALAYTAISSPPPPPPPGGDG